MLFEQEFIEKIENNPIEGISKACAYILDKQHSLDHGQGGDWSEEEHSVLMEGAIFLSMAIDANGLHFESQMPEITNDITDNCGELVKYINGISSALKIELIQLQAQSYKKRYESVFNSVFAYEFSQGDLERIQILINEIRIQIVENDKFVSGHKQRLLQRLEKLQSELHKRVSDLDRFWGLIGDAGVVLGKLGEDAKPIVDRIKEIAEITWKTQARTEELPSDISNPVIEHDQA